MYTTVRKKENMHFGVSLVDEIHNNLIDFGYVWGQMNVHSRELQRCAISESPFSK